MRLRGHQSNRAPLVITLVVVVALFAAGYVLFVAPR